MAAVQTGLQIGLSFGKTTSIQLIIRKSKDAHHLYTVTLARERRLVPDSSEGEAGRQRISILCFSFTSKTRGPEIDLKGSSAPDGPAFCPQRRLSFFLD